MQAAGEVKGDWQASVRPESGDESSRSSILSCFRNLEVTLLLFYTLRKRRLALLDSFQTSTSDVLGVLEDLRHQDKKDLVQERWSILDNQNRFWTSECLVA